MSSTFHIGKTKIALAVSSGLLLAGCFGPDYPTEGKLDTQLVTDRIAVVDIRGHVYGVQEGTTDLIQTWKDDQNAIYDFETGAWNALVEGNSVPDLSVSYPLSDSPFDAGKFKSMSISEMEADIAEAKKSVEVRKEELSQSIKNYETTLANIQTEKDRYDADVGKAAADVEKARQALNQAIESYNNISGDVQSDLRDLAEANGINRGTIGNPLRSYRTMRFNEGSVPGECPNKRYYMEVDVLDERGECLLIKLPDSMNGLADKVSNIVSGHYVTMVGLSNKLGEKGSWSSKPTGLYLALKNAEKELKVATATATDQYGSERQRQYKLNDTERNLAQQRAAMAEVVTDEYMAEQLNEAFNGGRSEELDGIFEAYEKAIESDLLSKVVKGQQVTFVADQETATFDDLQSGYEVAGFVGTIVGEKAGRRDATETVMTVDLTSPSVLEADEIIFEANRDSFMDARRLDIDDSQEVSEKLIDLVIEMMEDKAKAKG